MISTRVRERAWGALTAMTAVTLAGTALGQHYHRTDLVSNGGVPATNTDSHLVNGWGVAFNPTGFVWVADNGTGFSTLYDGNGVPQSLVVSIPSTTAGENGPVTGIAFSGGSDFVVNNGTTSAPARFIFATEEGLIAAWAPQVDLNHALPTAVSPSKDAIYKGLALAPGRLFATDFHNGRVDVFDGSFQPVSTPGHFHDSWLPADFAPFGIACLDGKVFVTFAKQDEKGEEEIAGPGLGAVDMFDTDGHLLRRVAHGGHLNAPWGLALSPEDFGSRSRELLVGNFGDGRINGYKRHPNGFTAKGPLRDEHGHPIVIDGLWGIAFGNGVQNQPTDTLFFAAGPDDEKAGVYGRIDRVQHGHP